MQVIVSIRHGKLSQTVREQIQVKLQKLTRLCDRITEIDVIVDLGNYGTACVEVQVSLEHSGDILAVVDADNVMSAVDQAQHKIEQQLRKHKQKRTDHRSPALRHVVRSGSPDEEQS